MTFSYKGNAFYSEETPFLSRKRLSLKGVRALALHRASGVERALPTETKVENGTSQSKSRTSVNLSNSGELLPAARNPCGTCPLAHQATASERRGISLNCGKDFYLEAKALSVIHVPCSLDSGLLGGECPYRGTSLIRNNPSLGPYSRLMSGALGWS